MIIRRLILRVVSPFFYYTQGGIFGDTGPFIGDIALIYAISYSLGLIKWHPTYEGRFNDISKLPFIITVGKPVFLRKKKIMSVASSFENSLKTYRKIFLRKGGSIPYKNVRRIRAIDYGSIFESYYVSNSIDLPVNNFIIRIGSGRDGMVNVQVEDPIYSDEVWLNLFTLKSKGISIDLVKENIVKELTVYNNYYVIIKGISVKDFIDLMVKKFS